MVNEQDSIRALTTQELFQPELAGDQLVEDSGNTDVVVKPGKTKQVIFENFRVLLKFL